jgi:hypothetical protein
MGMSSRLGGTSFEKITLVMWLLSAALSAFILNRIDGIVHGDLYDYGLVFSYNWASGYWVLLRLLYVCLALPSVLSIIVLGSSLRKTKEDQFISLRAVRTNGVQGSMLKENCMIISCPSCRKMFSEPLTMLDFSTGNANLVNVCPYCSHVLENIDKKKPEDVQVFEPEKKVTQ